MFSLKVLNCRVRGAFVVLAVFVYLLSLSPAKAEPSETDWRTLKAYAKWLYYGGWQQEFDAFYNNYMSSTVYKDKAECLSDLRGDASRKIEPFAVAQGSLVGLLASPQAGLAVYNASRQAIPYFASRAYCNLVNSEYGIVRRGTMQTAYIYVWEQRSCENIDKLVEVARTGLSSANRNIALLAAATNNYLLQASWKNTPHGCSANRNYPVIAGVEGDSL